MSLGVSQYLQFYGNMAFMPPILEEAIVHVEQHGQSVGNAPRVPTGV